MTDASTSATTITAAAAAPAAPSEIQSAVQTLLDHLKQAGQSELAVAMPLLGTLFRVFVAKYESHLTGITGMIVRPMINSFVDSVFGPAPTA